MSNEKFLQKELAIRDKKLDELTESNDKLLYIYAKQTDRMIKLKESNERLKEVLIHCKTDVSWCVASPTLKWINKVLKQAK